jgi:hypothetical protein
VKAKPSNIQVAVDWKRKYSKRNHEDYYEIEFIDNETGVLNKTYASDNNFNFRIWEQLINHMEDHPANAVAVYGNFRYVNSTANVLNADVKFRFEDEFNRDQFMNVVFDTYYQS